MNQPFISEDDIQKALDYLRDNASAAAEARANRQYVEEFRKTMKAQLMQEHSALPLGAQERNAYADARYIAHLDAIREAVEIDEKHRFLTQAAMAKIDAWRTMQATERAARI